MCSVSLNQWLKLYGSSECLNLELKAENMNKKITHMRGKWDTSLNFFLIFIDELEKQLFIKQLLKSANKNVRVLIFTMLYFF